MAEPIFTDTLEDAWRRLPQHYRDADEKNDWVFKKWLSGMYAQADRVAELVERFEFIAVEEGGRGTSDLIDARYADEEWFQWIAMMRSQKFNPFATEAQNREILYGSGYNIGTKQSIIDVAKTALSGSRFCQVYERTRDDTVPGGGLWYEMLIVTRASETMDDVVELVVGSGVKPMGIHLFYKQYETPWSTIHGTFPTWAEWNAATWQTIQESGF